MSDRHEDWLRWRDYAKPDIDTHPEMGASPMCLCGHTKRAHGERTCGFCLCRHFTTWNPMPWLLHHEVEHPIDPREVRY